jgi:hypothetical protein
MRWPLRHAAWGYFSKSCFQKRMPFFYFPKVFYSFVWICCMAYWCPIDAFFSCDPLSSQKNRVARFFVVQHTKNVKKIFISDDQKIYRKYKKWSPLKCFLPRRTKFTQIRIFGMKIHIPSGNPSEECPFLRRRSSSERTNCWTLRFLPLNQGGRIGRIFTDWAIVFYGHFLENYRSRPNFWSTFFHGSSYVVFFTKAG